MSRIGGAMEKVGWKLKRTVYLVALREGFFLVALPTGLVVPREEKTSHGNTGRTNDCTTGINEKHEVSDRGNQLVIYLL